MAAPDKHPIDAARQRRQPAAAIWRSRNGTSLIEFGFIAPIVTLLTLGLVDFGIGFWQQMQVGNGARAGAEYAAKYTRQNGFDATAIGNAVTGATSLAVQASPAPSQGCFCPNNNTLTSVTCNAGCSSSGTAATYVTVNAQASYSTLFPWPGVTQPIILKASATVRVN